MDNLITALFMGELDSKTGKWFPVKKMTWLEKVGQNYSNCSIRFVKGAESYKSLYPNQRNLFTPKDLTRVMKYQDVLKCAWNNRMPIARSINDKHKQCLGFTLSVDPIEYVARDGGYRKGDLCDLFPEVSPDEQGNYNFIFRGIDTWVMRTSNRPELETIKVGNKVTLQLPQKQEMLAGEWSKPMIEPPPESIRTKIFAEGQMMGYAPHYISDLFTRFGDKLKIEVFQINPYELINTDLIDILDRPERATIP